MQKVIIINNNIQSSSRNVNTGLSLIQVEELNKALEEGYYVAAYHQAVLHEYTVVQTFILQK